MEKTTTVKTIDINAKEWFDKVNGNSYFSALVVINFGMEDEQTIKLPFQYGYGNQYTHEAFAQLKKQGFLADTGYAFLRDNGIIVREFKEKNCKQRDCKAFVK